MTDITADMIERACKAYHLGIYGYPCLITDMQRKGMEAAIREVLQLVEEAQTADTYRIRPLEWEEIGDIFHAGPRVDFIIFKPEERSSSHRISIAGGTYYGSLAELKKLAESHWRGLLLDSVLEEV